MDDPTSISKFSKEFVVAERCVKDYLEYLTLLDLKKDKRKKERHIIQQQIQGFTQEEGSPLCSSENEEEYLYSLMMKAFKQTMSLPRLARVQRMMMRKGMIFRSQ